MATFTLSDDFELVSVIGARSGHEARTFAVTVADLPAVSIERLLRYGFQRFVNDGLGGADVPLEDKLEAAQKKVDALMAGEVAARRNAATGGDPVQHEARKLIRADLRKNKAVWAKFKAMDDAEQIETLDKLLANPKNAKYLEKARELVDLKADAPAVDLGGMDI